jgi:hypothetical protein
MDDICTQPRLTVVVLIFSGHTDLLVARIVAFIFA